MCFCLPLFFPLELRGRSATKGFRVSGLGSGGSGFRFRQLCGSWVSGRKAYLGIEWLSDT